MSDARVVSQFDEGPLIGRRGLSWPECAMSAVGGKSGLGALAVATTGIDPEQSCGPLPRFIWFGIGKRTLGDKQSNSRA